MGLQEVDMEMLPKVLQVRKFGLAGRTKYTHLADQDTTKAEANPWAAAVNEYGVKKDPFKKS
jgi:microfibrillar-associated protein 1